jgi:hypothetical protein
MLQLITSPDFAFGTVVVLFLTIFTATSIIALLAVVGTVNIPEEFRRKLFNVLIVQVVTSVVGFGAEGLHRYWNYEIPVTSHAMTGTPKGWAWVFRSGKQRWYTAGYFEPAGSEWKWKATTHYIGAPPPTTEGGAALDLTAWEAEGDPARGPAIIDWEGDPFTVFPLGQKEITFRARMTYLAAGGVVEPMMANIVGKPRNITVKLRSELALRGTWQLDGTDQAGDILFYQRSPQ